MLQQTSSHPQVGCTCQAQEESVRHVKIKFNVVVKVVRLNNYKQNHLQKDASKHVKRGQLINASDKTPHPFNSRETICVAPIQSTFNLGQMPKFRDLRPTCDRNTIINSMLSKINQVSAINFQNFQDRGQQEILTVRA